MPIARPARPGLAGLNIGAFILPQDISFSITCATLSWGIILSQS